VTDERIEIPDGILPTDDLPDGWTVTTARSIADVVGGGTPKSSESENFSEDGHAWITPADLSGFRELYIRRGRRDLSDKGLRSCSAVLMPKGTVLMSSRAPIGYVAIAANTVCTNQGFKSFVCHSDIDPEFVYFWLRFITLYLQEMGSGSTFMEISGSRAQEVPTLLAPAVEQRRIAAQIKRILPSVNSACDHLSSVPSILKRFRQAVLAAACSGRLTEDWRSTQNQRDEDATGEIPVGWRSVQLAKVADTIDPNPSHRYPSYENGTVPILATEQFRGLNDWDLSTAKLVAPSFYAERNATHGFKKDDIVFARKGRLGLARRPPDVEKYVFSHTIFIIRTRSGTLSDYLLWFLRQSSCVAWLLHEMNSNTGVPTLGKSYMEKLPVQLPPFEEQEEIVRRLEALFKLADCIENRVIRATKRAEKLTHSILAKAFRGELVPTEAELARREGREYEPASVLLERIRRERESRSPSKHTRTRIRLKARRATTTE
jgi:type I restriction enzyme S subunit